MEKKKTKLVSTPQMARDLGLKPQVIQAVFNHILYVIASGKSVYAHGFGLFRPRIYPGRTINTPVYSKKKALKFPDSLGVHLRIHRLAKINLELMHEQFKDGIDPSTGKPLKPKKKPNNGRPAVTPPPLLGTNKKKKKKKSANK